MSKKVATTTIVIEGALRKQHVVQQSLIMPGNIWAAGELLEYKLSQKPPF